ncbi:MAG TPA: GAF domain-containing protein, partial [Daejeonella sp.]|nr:GAF domain-containing protein [Daejeonella sp.]
MIEDYRLKTLLDYHILDTAPEREFDSITRLASYICKTPFALITFLDDQRQWIKSSFGLSLKQTQLHEAFCAYTILDDTIFQVRDSLLDERFRDNPLVHEPPHIRFYAGAPLVSPEGYRLGSICVLDTQPGELSLEQQDALKVLAEEVISHLEMRKKNREI